MLKIAFPIKVNVELVKLLYQQLPFLLWAESFCAIGVVIALSHALDPRILFSWLLFNLIACGLARHVLVHYFKKNIDHFNARNVNFWLVFFGLGALVSGISWGSAGWILMVKNDLMAESFVIFLLLGVTATGNIFYSANRAVYAIFLLPAFTPLAMWLIEQGQTFFVLGILSIVYMATMLVVSFFYNSILKKSIDLRFENVDLVTNLYDAKNMLEHRTGTLEKTLALVTATFESTTDGIVVIDSHDKIENYNNKFISMWDIPEEILRKRNVGRLIEHISKNISDANEFKNSYHEIIVSPQKETHIELKSHDGRILEYFSHPQMLGDTCVGHVLTFRDISNRKMLEQKLFHQANFDSLTNLPNRALLLDRFQHAAAYVRNTDLHLAVFFIDIDRFKLINDTLGHTVGDNLLVEVAKRLTKVFNENDTVSREGGDEFIAILTSLKEEAETISIARHCLATMHEPFYIDANKISITISIGISFWPKDGRDAEALIKNADIAMYRAKELGRNNFQFFTEEMNKRVLDKLVMENQLRNALEQNEFTVLYQPIVSLKTGKIVGLEALLRWYHPLLGSISPSDFIPVAEESGLITLIGDWVLRVACAQAKEWQRKGINGIQMSVNLSGRQFKQANFFEQIEQIISGIELDPHTLTLELTESIIMEDVEKNIEVLNKLKKMGVVVVIDDFGVGYSSLNYLKRLPVDKLKIDRSFIEDVPLHADDAAITAAIIALAGKLNLKVVAEGVENESQLKFLIKHYCDEIQGFYFSNPIDGDTCLKLLRENKAMQLPSIL